jgi:hypothetical protein
MANAVTDLVAQAQTVTRSELNAYLQLGETILKPYPSDDLTFVIARCHLSGKWRPRGGLELSKESWRGRAGK